MVYNYANPAILPFTGCSSSTSRDAESNSPAPDFDTPRARKSSKKGKSRAGDLEVSTPAPNGKRKRAAAGGKSTSMTPSLMD